MAHGLLTVLAFAKVGGIALGLVRGRGPAIGSWAGHIPSCDECSCAASVKHLYCLNMHEAVTVHSGLACMPGRRFRYLCSLAA